MQYNQQDKQKYLLFICKDDDKPGTFSAGEHHFRFAFTLPYGIPSIYVGHPNGDICYKISVSLKAPPFYFDIEDSFNFLVTGLLDLNSYPWLREPFEIDKIHQVSGWCCGGDGWEIEYKLKLQRTAFIWGEVIPLSIQIYLGIIVARRTLVNGR